MRKIVSSTLMVTIWPSRAMPARPRRADQHRSEPLRPPQDREVIYLETTQVPAHRHRDHLREEAKPRKVWPQRKYSQVVMTHRLSLPDAVIRPRKGARSAQIHGQRVQAVEQDPWSPG
jgi:hypothetical protein